MTRSECSFSTIRASVLLPVLGRLKECGGDVDALLARHGLSRRQIGDAYMLVPMARYLAAFEDAAGVLRDPVLGARLGTRVQPSDIGPVGILFSRVPTIGEAFEGMSRYMNALQGGTLAMLEEDPASPSSVWSYRLTDAGLGARRQDAEFTLSASCQLARASFSARWAPLEVHFEHAEPGNAAALEDIFRAPVRFGQGVNRLVMDRARLSHPHRPRDSGLLEVLQRHIAELQKDHDIGVRLRDLVRTVLATRLGHRPVTIASVASDLGLSSRTLQRRLAEEGTSLRDLLRAYRAETARAILGAGQATCSEVATRLGYSDATAFWRAYRDWTGHAPSSAAPR